MIKQNREGKIKTLTQELKINDNYQKIPIDSVIPDPDNAKTHSKKDIENKKAALRRYGFTRPLIINSESNVIVAGNGFWTAAKELGYTEVPALLIPLSASRAKSLGMSDNLLGDQSAYNLEIFNQNIKEIDEWESDMDWAALGFSSGEIQLLLASMNTSITDSGVPQEGGQDSPQDFDEDSAPARPIKLTKAQREIIELGVKSLRESENNPKMSEGQCAELIFANYLSSV